MTVFDTITVAPRLPTKVGFEVAPIVKGHPESRSFPIDVKKKSSIQATFVLGLLTIGLLVTFITAASRGPVATVTPMQVSAGSFFTEIFGSSEAAADGRPASVRLVEIVSRLLLAVVLAAILALRPRRNIRLFRRNLYVSQTEILLAVVAAALMMIVGDNAARAFGIFAAVSLVRFRTNIRDPKEIAVLLISLALGLAAGVGRWEIGVSLSLFTLALLWLLEYKEPGLVFRSMVLKVKARNVTMLHELLQDVFTRRDLEVEIREIDPPDAKKGIGAIIYYINMPLSMSTDELSQDIISASQEQLEGIEWEQEKHNRNIYD